MSEELTKIVVNCSTGQQEVVPLTAEEISQREFDAIVYAEKQAEEQAAAEAKEASKDSGKAKLASLGLSEDEISALLG
jgi:hypothetical protein